MAKVLITGINGFTGRYLADELRAANFTVTGLGHELSDSPFRCDLLNRSGLASVLEAIRPDVIVHLAAIAYVQHGDAEALYRTNVVGTRNLLEAVVAAGCRPRSVILASSANIYGNALQEPIDESTILSPENDYGVSKLAMEYMARLWSAQLPIVVVRPFNYTGVGQSLKFLLPKIVDHFRRRAPIIELGNLNVVRDFSDVRSVAMKYRLLIEAGAAGKVFNFCSGHGYSLFQVLQIMREISGHNPEIRVNRDFVRVNEVQRLIGSQAKLAGTIGTVPEIPLADTLRWMLDSAT